MLEMPAAAEPREVAHTGGSFLVQDGDPSEAFAPEDFDEGQRQAKAEVTRFNKERVVPSIPALELKEPGLARRLIREAGALGYLGVGVPEHYGGMELDLTTQMIVIECLGTYASFATTYAAHSGIGTLPVLFFGTEGQRTRYLPRLVNGDLLAAYCLSEPQAGSDSLNSLTRAELNPDRTHYILNGQKMWISNGGWADLYTVFAKVGGKHFTAFLVERSWEGVEPGVEEHKMGLRGSSTTALNLDNVRVPVENVLGEVGRGHVIAFNILNLGRLELAASCVGAAKDMVAESAQYALQRTAFGKPIGEFGAIRRKLADMSVHTFAGESLTYRTAGMIDARLAGFSWDAPNAERTALKAIEEYAIECSIAKIYLSEVFDSIVDEAVQIHGGNGYHQDYAVERAYRDSRINRIFEGTNEINRLLMAGMLFKRVAQNRLDLMEVAGADDDGAGQRGHVARAKRATLSMARLAWRSLGPALEQHQEVCAALADMMIGTYAAESAWLRAQRFRKGPRHKAVHDLVTVLLVETMTNLRNHGSLIVGACCSGADLDSASEALECLVRTRPVNLPRLRHRIAGRVLKRGAHGF